jgi:hypothetical protein
MEKQAMQKFAARKVEHPNNILGGAIIKVWCKDSDGEILGTYLTECEDHAYWITDCRGLFPGAVTAVGGPV